MDKSAVLIALKRAIAEGLVPYINKISVPLTKTITKTIAIEDGMNINSLQEKISNISKKHKVDEKDIWISVDEDEDFTLGCNTARLCACFKAEVKKSGKDIHLETKKRVNNSSFGIIHRAMTAEGFKRVGFGSNLLAPFDDTTVYDMAIAEEFDRLADYFSLYFDEQTPTQNKAV